MINRIKRDLICLWKLHKRETSIFIFSTLFAYVYISSYTPLATAILILGLLAWFSSIICIRCYIDKFQRFFYNKPLLSSRQILFQNTKKCKHNCQEVMASLLSKKKVKETISKLPKGDYKSVTHKTVINAIKTFDKDIYISRVLFNDKLSNIRKRLLGKKCPCSNDVECRYKKYLAISQCDNDKVSFHYIEFTIK